MAKRTDVKAQGRNRFAQFDADITSAYDDDDNYDSFQPHNSRFGNRNKVSQNVSKGHDNRKFQKDSLAKSGRMLTKQIMFCIVVKGCNQCSTDEIITEIQGYTTAFLPYLPTKTEKGDVQFYVKDAEISTSLQQLSRRVKNPKTNSNLLIMTAKSTCSWNKLPVGHKEIIEYVCKSRLSGDGKSLDLSNFSSDPYFKTKGIMVSLQRAEVMIAVVDFVYTTCPDIINLSLKSTGIKRLDVVASMVHAAPMIKVLDLSCNMIDKISELGRIRAWKLEGLFLENTGAANAFTEAAEYSRIVQGYFPYLVNLDGIQLSPSESVSTFEDEAKIVIKPGFCPSPEIKTVLGMFISQYFDIFDGPDGRTNRKQLADAYDENAMFSLVCDATDDGNHSTVLKNRGKLREPEYKIYRSVSHNFKYEDKWRSFRTRTYGKGNLEVLAMLCRLPPTEHIRESFVMDVSMTTDTIVTFTLQGMFNDGEQYFSSSRSISSLKYFTRSFVCLPRGGTALSIISDILTVHPIDSESASKYESYCVRLKNEQPAFDTSAAVNDLTANLGNTSTNNPTTTTPVVNTCDPEIREAMVKSFMEQSGMNEVWSRRCLEESDWNYSLAGDRFLSLKNDIPAEAFAK
uniref:Nuclear RNA export factor 2 (inferred by orthology to a D. melanogaster protein) n=1 Tax=Strongyloides venezuelensis TaxID=75913 RepID=A0A0K0G0N4_STRVS